MVNKNIKLFDGSFDSLTHPLNPNVNGFFTFVLDLDAEKILWLSDEYGIEKNANVSLHFEPKVQPYWIKENKSNSMTLGHFENEDSLTPMLVYIEPHEGYLFGAATINALR